MADLVTLMTIDIPEGRNSLLESQTNLEKVTFAPNAKIYYEYYVCKISNFLFILVGC